MKRGKTLVHGIVMVLFLFFAATGAWAQSDAPVKIGFMGNLSAAPCVSARAAAQMAVDEMNAAGGILGRSVVLIVEDTKGEIPKAVELYKKLAMTDKVTAIVVAEKVEMAVAGMEIGSELYREYPHVMFSTIGSGDVIWHRVRDNYDKYKFGFQTYYAVSTHYLTSFSHLNASVFKDLVGAKRMALIYEDMEWTRPLRRGLEGVSPKLSEVYKSQGLEVVHETTVSTDQKMFTPIFEQIAAKGVDVIDCVIGYIDQGAFIKQWEQSSARDIPMFIWGGLAGMPPAWPVTQGKILGLMVGSSMTRVAITDKTIPFMDNLTSKYKVGPIFGSHTTYDTLYGFKKAVENAGGVEDVDALIGHLETVEEVAVLGAIGWDAKLHYNLPYPKYITPVVQWQMEGDQGEMKVIFPSEFSTTQYTTPAALRK
jgi:branched-chain amino acid transport system substrate-binding protein